VFPFSCRSRCSFVGDALHRKDAASSTSLSPLESAIVKTAEGMHVMRDAAFYNKARYERHTETINSTNARILFWSAGQSWEWCIAAAKRHARPNKQLDV